VKGVAMAVANKDDEEDDFMGFVTIPLKNVPVDGLDSWFKLRQVSTLQVSFTSISENLFSL